MTRIAFVITGLEVGGAETMLLKLISHLPPSRFEPTVVSLRSGGPMADQFRAAAVNVVEVGVGGATGLITGIPRLRRVARELRPHLLQGWMYHGNLGALVMHRALGRRPALLWSVRITADSMGHEKAMTRRIMRLGARFSRQPDKIIYNSSRAADQHADLGYARGNATVLPNGFDTERFAPSAQNRAATRSRLGLPEEARVVGIVGRYHPIKDHATFLESARLVLDSAPGTRFLLVGQGLERSNAEVAASVSRLGLENACILAGRQENLEAVYPAMDVHVSSSVSEGFANVLGEAMSCGVPCVTTDVGDSASVVADTGLVVPRRDPAGLAQAILTLLEESDSQHAERCEGARQRVLEHYSIAEVARQYATIYEELGARPKPGFATTRSLVCEGDKQ